MNLTKFFLTAAFSAFFLNAFSGTHQNGIPFNLYPGAIPNSKNVPDEEKLNKDGHPCRISRPTLTAYIPEHITSRSAVIICPGGGYGCECITHEGEHVAREFNRYGVTAFVLKYRLPSDKWCIDKTIAPLQDAQRAIQYARENAENYGYDAQSIGIIGFSAGGHLAGSATIFGGKDYIPNEKKLKLRPDYAMLIYPRVTFTQPCSSKNNLIGKNASRKECKRFSLEQHVDKDTSPIFIVQATDDSSVPINNAIMLFNALEAQGHKPSMHIYSKGEHGLGSIGRFEWMSRCIYWMNETGVFKPTGTTKPSLYHTPNPQNMEKIFNFIKSCKAYYLATADAQQPRVRPFGTINIFDGKLYIQTGRKKRIARQLKENPKAELCCFDGKKWLRLSGRLISDNRPEAKKSMLDAYPELRSMYNEADDNTLVYYFQDAIGCFSSFTEPDETLLF